MFTRDDLIKIAEYSRETANEAMRCASAMAQKTFRHRDGSVPSKDQIDCAFEEWRAASAINRKAMEMIDRIEFPGTTAPLMV